MSKENNYVPKKIDSNSDIMENNDFVSEEESIENIRHKAQIDYVEKYSQIDEVDESVLEDEYEIEGENNTITKTPDKNNVFNIAHELKLIMGEKKKAPIRSMRSLDINMIGSFRTNEVKNFEKNKILVLSEKKSNKTPIKSMKSLDVNNIGKLNERTNKLSYTGSSQNNGNGQINISNNNEKSYDKTFNKQKSVLSGKQVSARSSNKMIIRLNSIVSKIYKEDSSLTLSESVDESRKGGPKAFFTNANFLHQDSSENIAKTTPHKNLGLRRTKTVISTGKKRKSNDNNSNFGTPPLTPLFSLKHKNGKLSYKEKDEKCEKEEDKDDKEDKYEKDGNLEGKEKEDKDFKTEIAKNLDKNNYISNALDIKPIRNSVRRLSKSNNNVVRISRNI